MSIGVTLRDCNATVDDNRTVPVAASAVERRDFLSGVRNVDAKTAAGSVYI
jgi:hypothetical protein